jgi:hypothetical protein
VPSAHTDWLNAWQHPQSSFIWPDLSIPLLQACTTDGKQLKNAPGIPGKGCKGDKAMFKWDNSYFQNVKSGKCEPRNHRPQEAEWCVCLL